MYHIVAQSLDRTPLWTTWRDGLALFHRIARGCPCVAALVVMPDHLHLVHPLDVRVPLARVLSADTRSRRARDPAAAAFGRVPPAEPLADAQKIRRAVRYVHLNPCRAGLRSDPLSWPLSTHRDHLGLALPTIVRPRADPERFHAYVSGDPSADVRGTALPVARPGPRSPQAVFDAVSALTRTPASDLRRRGPARTLVLAACRALCDAPAAEVTALVAVRPEQASRATAPPEAVKLVQRVVGDPRFRCLIDGTLQFGER